MFCDKQKMSPKIKIYHGIHLNVLEYNVEV